MYCSTISPCLLPDLGTHWKHFLSEIWTNLISTHFFCVFIFGFEFFLDCQSSFNVLLHIYWLFFFLILSIYSVFIFFPEMFDFLLGLSECLNGRFVSRFPGVLFF